MSNVTTIKGSLFDAPKGSIIAHACNCKGVWGSGIAKEFAKRFPGSYNVYRAACVTKGSSLLGTCLLIPSGAYTIACLFTSKNYGQYVDKPETILKSTYCSISDMILQVGDLQKPIHMCKINSGLFKVDWNDTKAILKKKEQVFIVYDF